ncbi:MAG: DUF3427 domain-containing protein [Planctomycetes bacterium]|jgi:superfamily II DNA or RNA helicase|nr:DUF3427 domain-containing protein [Planctomycetota bacterium]
MTGGERGLYEALITSELEARLRELRSGLQAIRRDLSPADAADRISRHVAEVVRRVLEDVNEKERIDRGMALTNALLLRVDELVEGANAALDIPIAQESVLRAILRRLPDSTAESIPEPKIPLLDTALLTNAPGEPTVGSQIESEIYSADRIDVVMAFIRRSGIFPLLEALRRHRDQGRQLRVLTTTYTGSTEQRALDDLQQLGASIRVSYDTTTTRLHAKAWLFQRNSGFSTAYIGSSNLTHSAQVSGLEWNVRVSGARNQSVVGKVATVFEAYWNHPDFEDYEPSQFALRCQSSRRDFPSLLNPTDLRLEPFQERLLEQIEVSRAAGHHRNLLAAATGTGKTVMAAVDYKRLRIRLPRARLLFVAHRQEILRQSLGTFRHALRDASFGELWVGGSRPSAFEHVFASIQSLDASGYEHLDHRHFDVVIVDEFHHAAAASYRRLLDHIQPVELLGLTATPERGDGESILPWFGDRIAAELRLWDAIDQHYLVPFLYYGIADSLDLREVPWRRGRGYDTDALTNVYTASDRWAGLVINQLQRHINDVGKMKALGFCVSVRHAEFMARQFVAAGIAAVAVSADTADTERSQVLQQLQSGRLQVIFSVDLYNEGIDVRAVDVLLFLRPTDSPTLFLQQLGRGLRRDDGKSVCTVLDFVGQHRREFRFDRRFRALLGGSRKQLEEQIENGFPFLPAGCNLQLDSVAREIVLRNVRDAIPSQWKAKAAELRQLASAVGKVALSKFLDETGYDLSDVYSGGRGWSDLCSEAGLAGSPVGQHETALRRGIGRLLHVDDLERIDAWRRWLRTTTGSPPDLPHLRDQRLLRMLVANVADQVLNKHNTLAEALAMLREHPQVCFEMLELLDVLANRIDHAHPQAKLAAEAPLQVHARYTRIEILAAMGVGTAAGVASWQSGVFWVEPARTDLLAFTLDKTSGQFSPTTSYKDRAISRELIRWESQGVTRSNSETGQRYQQHVAMGTQILLFARLRADDRAFWFLGPATYVSHEGERPMAITWRLDHPLPGDLYAQFAAAVA